MTKVVLDDSRVVAVLDQIQQRFEICDAGGRVLGVHVPPGSSPIGELSRLILARS